MNGGIAKVALAADTETIERQDAQANWPAILDRVRRGETRVLVLDGDAPIAAVISPVDFDLFQRWDAKRRQAFKILDEIGERFKDVPDEEIAREVTRAIAEARAENRRRRTAEAAPAS